MFGANIAAAKFWNKDSPSCLEPILLLPSFGTRIRPRVWSQYCSCQVLEQEFAFVFGANIVVARFWIKDSLSCLEPIGATYTT